MVRPSRIRLTVGLAPALASGALITGGLVLGSPPALANTAEPADYRQSLPAGGISKASKAARWAGLSPGQCQAEVTRRGLGVKRWKGFAVGVATPMRVTAAIGGVRFLTPGGKSPYGVLDCRLALALSELASVLARHGVVEVRVDNMYRPRAHLPGKKKPSQHAYGLAIDLTRFKLQNGEELVIEQDFEGKLGEPVCGPEARGEALTGKALQLRNLVCDVVRAEIFHHILTPNHNAAHRDHFHLDIARGARQRIVE